MPGLILFVFLFLISGAEAVVDLGAVTNTGTAHRQITTFDIAGDPGSDPSTYRAQIMVKDYSKYSDGRINVTGSKKYRFQVGELLVDSEGNVIPENVTLMTDFIALFQNRYLAEDASPTAGR